MDQGRIGTLVANANNPVCIQAAQNTAETALLNTPSIRQYTLADACAATLSAMLQGANIQVPMTIWAPSLAGLLATATPAGRGWQRIGLGSQIEGDVGVVLGQITQDDGTVTIDVIHVYLVAAIAAQGADLMTVVDNQGVPGNSHPRSARGLDVGYGAKSATDHFLRATPP